MTKVQTLRAVINQRLTAAAEEIFELFERTIAEYEEELCRQHKLLDAVFNPEVRLHRADVQLLLVSKEEVPPPLQQEWSPSLDQEDPPELPHIKQEQEELWTTQEGEQLQGLEETDVTFTPVALKSEQDDLEKPQSSQRQTEQMKTKAGGEDCGGPEPAKNFNLDCYLQPDACGKTSHYFEHEADDSCGWEHTRGPQSGLNPLQNNGALVRNMDCNTGKTSVSTSQCDIIFGHNGHLQKHNGIQTGGKPFSCSVCGKRYPRKNSLMVHMRIHSEGKSFSCLFCKKTFPWRANFVTHMRIHTGEKPFTCSVCDVGFSQKEHLRQHVRTHTGEKPFSCSVCGRRFAQSSALSRHLKLHGKHAQFVKQFSGTDTTCPHT